MIVKDTVVAHNGAAQGGGIKVAPVGVTGHAILSGVTINKNTNGIAGFTGGNIQIYSSTITSSTATGIINGGTGNIRIGRSVIASNLGASLTGTVLSYGDNQVNDNNPDTAPTLVPGGYK
jgi:hypothetical protein